MLDGDVTIRGINAPVDVGFDEILDNLDFAVMGAVEIGNGQWGFLADLFYAELSSSNSRGNLDFRSQIDQFIGNFVVTYNVIDQPETRFDLYAGARVNSLDTDLDILTNKIGTFSDSASKTWVDPIIGVRLQQELPNRFFVRAVGDIGGFGVSSDLTWQALAALGYHINDSASVLLGYRGIGTDYEDGQFGYDVISHGVLLGFEYKF
jgi:opacity protein-like surface antigen